jgi:hypothetical protein
MRDVGTMLTDTFGFVRGAAAQQKVYRRMKADHVLDERTTQCQIPDESYFQLTLSEMFLVERREYWRSFLPMVLVLADFVFNNDKRSVPVFVGNELLKSLEHSVQNEEIEFRNTTILGPTPYLGGGLHLFVGLFRTKTEDLASSLADLANSIGSVFPVAELSRYVQLLAPLAKSVSTFLGMKDVELRIGIRDEFAQKAEPNIGGPGYFVIINTTGDQEDLWIQNGQLWSGKDGPRNRFRSHDFCVFRLDFVPDRPIADLSFAKLWTEIKDLVWHAQVPRAQAMLLELGRQMAVSPDLTRTHRFNLIRLYKANLEREIELCNEIGSSQPIAASRGGHFRGGGAASIKSILPFIPASSDLRKSISSLAANWGSVMAPYQGGPDIVLDDNVLQRQLNELAKLSDKGGDPGELMKVLELATIR